MLARAEDLVFIPPVLLGFALKNKQWRKISKPQLLLFVSH
jgi:hypothetical protein